MSTAKPEPDAAKADQQAAEALQRHEAMLRLELTARRERLSADMIKVGKDS